MTRRELFEQVGGLSTSLPVNYNDMDYCLKLRTLGKRVVYDPDLVMYHFESSSRDTDVAEWEKERLLDRWARVTAVDPYSNPNLSAACRGSARRSTGRRGGRRDCAAAARLHNLRARHGLRTPLQLPLPRHRPGRARRRLEGHRPHVHEIMGRPQKVLDPAAGRGEFIGAVPAKETWAVDAVAYDQAMYKPDTKVVVSMIMDAELPADHFDGVYVSNFLEHLYDQEAIHQFLVKMVGVMEKGGRIAIMGPNYRYCSKEYWDYADHYVALTHVAIEEHLYSAGFEIERTIPQYLPYSFNGSLPTAPWMVGAT